MLRLKKHWSKSLKKGSPRTESLQYKSLSPTLLRCWIKEGSMSWSQEFMLGTNTGSIYTINCSFILGLYVWGGSTIDVYHCWWGLLCLPRREKSFSWRQKHIHWGAKGWGILDNIHCLSWISCLALCSEELIRMNCAMGFSVPWLLLKIYSSKR